MNVGKLDGFTGLVGLPLTHVWRGYGSALMLEFGSLRRTARRDGSDGPPQGDMSLMIEWSWRIEDQDSVLCGSFSERPVQDRAFSLIKNCSVATLSLFGRLPEIDIGFDNGLHVLSFMTAEGPPAWTLFDRRGKAVRWICVEGGRLVADEAAITGLLTPRE